MTLKKVRLPNCKERTVFQEPLTIYNTRYPRPMKIRIIPPRISNSNDASIIYI